MQSLSSALNKTTAVGRKVHVPWGDLNAILHVSTRELMVVAGAPGSGKSTFAVGWAAGTKDSTLYLTQDSPVSVYTRLTALTLGEPIHAIRQRMQAGGSLREGVADAVHFKQRDNLFVEGGRQSLEGIDERIVALTDYLGEAPKLVIVDNLIDLYVEGSTHSDSTFYAKALTGLKEIANTRDVMIMLLHHSLKNDSVGQGVTPLKSTDLLFGGDREARHVLGIFHTEDDANIVVQILKAQDGQSSPTGDLQVKLAWEPATGRLVSRK